MLVAFGSSVYWCHWWWFCFGRDFCFVNVVRDRELNNNCITTNSFCNTQVTLLTFLQGNITLMEKIVQKFSVIFIWKFYACSLNSRSFCCRERVVIKTAWKDSFVLFPSWNIEWCRFFAQNYSIFSTKALFEI